MHQDQTRHDRVDKTIRAEEAVAKGRGEIDGQDASGFVDNQLNMGIGTSQVWPGQNPNENTSNDRENASQKALDQQGSFDRESFSNNGPEDTFQDDPSIGTGRESPSKVQRDRRDQAPTLKGKCKTADNSPDTDSRERPSDTSSHSVARSQSRSESYDPYKKEQYLDDAHGRHSYDGGQRPQDPKANPPRESHTTRNGHNPERVGSKGSSNKHKHASGKASRTSEQREQERQEQERREQKRKWMEAMLRDPSRTYDDWLQQFSQKISIAQQQSDAWQARVSLLTEEMLAGRDRFQPATDGDLQSKMNTLREDVKKLVREMEPKQISETTFAGTLEGKQLALGKVEKTWAISLRAPILQSSIWLVLLHHMLGTPFIVFGHEGAQVENTWRTLFGEPASEHDVKSRGSSSGDKSLDEDKGESQYATPEPEEFCEKWKSMTAIRLKDKVAEKSVSTGREAKRALQKMLYALSGSSNQPSEEPSWLEKLKEVLSSATELAVLMAQQRSRLELFVPNLGKIATSKNHCCDGKTIDFDEGVEGPLGGKPVLIVTLGLRKWGDGFGGKLASFVDLEAAQVKCIQ